MPDVPGPPRIDSLRDMVIFVEVGRRETFSAAAKSLGLPISTVARRVASLEAELGLSLFERSTREQRLTAEGALCLERCRILVDDARTALEDVRAEVHGPRGCIRLAWPGEAPAGVLADIVAGFLRENEGVEIAVEAAHAGLRLGRDVDLMVCLGLPDGAAVVARRIGSVAFRLYASPRYLAAHGPVASPGDLHRHSVLAVRSCTGALAGLAADDRAPRINERDRLAPDALPLVAALALAGEGIGLLPPDVAAPHAAAGSLRPVLPGWTPVQLPVFVAMASRYLPARLRRFVDHLASRFPAVGAGTEGIAAPPMPRPPRGAGGFPRVALTPAAPPPS